MVEIKVVPKGKCPACGEELVEMDVSIGYGDKLFCVNPECRVNSVEREREQEPERDYFFQGSGIEEVSSE